MKHEADDQWKWNYGDFGHDESDEIFYYLLDDIVDILIERGMPAEVAVKAAIEIHDHMIDNAGDFCHVLYPFVTEEEGD